MSAATSVADPTTGRDHGQGLTPDQLDFRRTIVGASDVPKLFIGLDGRPVSRYGSAWSLYHEKTSKANPREIATFGTPAYWGNLLEHPIGLAFCDNMGIPRSAIRKATEYAMHPRVERFGALVDFWIDFPGMAPFVEIKHQSWRRREMWDGAPPLEYEIQVQAQLACTSASSAYLFAVFSGGESHAGPFLIERDDALIREIEAAVDGFWRMVDEGIEPEPDWGVDSDVLFWLAAETTRMRPDAPPAVLDHMIEDVTEFAALGAQLGQLADRRDAAKARLMDALYQAGAPTGTAGPYQVTSNLRKSTTGKPYRTLSVRRIKGE